MRYRYCIFAVLSGLCFAAQASFLKPAAFPTVADDLSFIDRIRLRAAGYDELNTVYDENGKCISGCAYAELNLEDELSAMARRDALVHSELVSEYGFNEQPDGSIKIPEVLRPWMGGMEFIKPIKK